MSIPILDLSCASDPNKKPQLLEQLRAALFDVGFLYISNHGISSNVISSLTSLLPKLFDLDPAEKAALSKSHNPHFLGYSGFAEETTLGRRDLREQFDFATELPAIYQGPSTNDVRTAATKDFSQLFWRLRGPNQWPSEKLVPGFREAVTRYHDAVQDLSYRFVHLIEEAFGIPTGTFDSFWGKSTSHTKYEGRKFLPPQHRIKLLRYPPLEIGSDGESQGVGAHKDSSGWLTFLYQVGHEPGLEVVSSQGDWVPVPPIENTFVVNFGNAFEAATDGAVKATIHRVIAPALGSSVRYSVPFFQGLPLDMTVSEVRSFIPESVRQLRRAVGGKDEVVSNFLDPRWDHLGESQLRKWIRSHPDVAEKWYTSEEIAYYSA